MPLVLLNSPSWFQSPARSLLAPPTLLNPPPPPPLCPPPGPPQELLHQLGMSHTTHLTRREWGLLRSSWGRPRRLSLSFLKEERIKLEAYRWGGWVCVWGGGA